jgi:hypothetical protein
MQILPQKGVEDARNCGIALGALVLVGRQVTVYKLKLLAQHCYF